MRGLLRRLVNQEFSTPHGRRAGQSVSASPSQVLERAAVLSDGIAQFRRNALTLSRLGRSKVGADFIENPLQPGGHSASRIDELQHVALRDRFSCVGCQ